MIYKANLNQLKNIYEKLKEEYTVVAPELNDGVIKYEESTDFEKIPAGYKQFEFAGSYQIFKSSNRFFSYIRPYNNLKYFLRPPSIKLLTVIEKDGNLEFSYQEQRKKIAFFDIRRCDLKALSILDKVYLNENYPDSYYKSLREDIFIVGVDCAEAGDVCFCNSMDIDFDSFYSADMFITEIDDGFLVDTVSKKAEHLVEGLGLSTPTKEDLAKRQEIKRRFKESFKKKLDTANLKEILYQKIEHPYWEEIGKRCLSCANCTQVCPTCFCFDIKEINSLDMKKSERFAVWDSCFNQTFATVHKFNIRDSIASRYRQWLMHKMAYWQDQFGDFGCVGCGRCITWCPAKIDIHIETVKLREI